MNVTGRAAALGILTATLIAAPTPAGVPQTAEYTVAFTATWSAESHPISFPIGAHFSQLVGGSHHAAAEFWTPGGIASPGIESMAETGATLTLRAEVQSAINIGTAREIIIGNGTSSPGGPVTTSFEVSQTHPLATVVTMIAPSPDWFVGVHGLNLFVDGAWAESLTVDLLPYDAGTDSGTTYSSPNEDTNPQTPITQITGLPFAAAGPVPPLGTFTFTLAIPCLSDVNDNGEVESSDVLSVIAAWGECFGSCPQDVNEDGMVGFADLLLVLGDFGPCG